MSWSSAVERTVAGMGYDLVDVERTGGGLLRVTIDRVPGKTYATGESEFVLVEDCEAVTRQLQYVLEVENCDYTRLEVTSPGLDRPLKRPEDFERFTGSMVEVTFKQPFQGRKKFAGELLAREGGWRVVLPAPELSKTKAKAQAKAKAAAPAAEVVDAEIERVLDFTLDELREARLVPVLDFKGRRRKAEPSAAPGEGAQSDDGGQEE
jgi:ribosome maturation factor RimP